MLSRRAASHSSRGKRPRSGHGAHKLVPVRSLSRAGRLERIGIRELAHPREGSLRLFYVSLRDELRIGIGDDSAETPRSNARRRLDGKRSSGEAGHPGSRCVAGPRAVNEATQGPFA